MEGGSLGREGAYREGACRLEKVAQVRDSSDALGQLEPRDALAAMSTPSFY